MQKYMASPGFEPVTFSVLDWRDNQLHHETITDSSVPVCYMYIP
jgi:hypothetical protein